jgi:hypothetical protein
MDDLKGALEKLKEKQAKNRVKFVWQDKALSVIEELSIPRHVHTEKSKKPLDARSILMRHAKQNLPVFERRFSLVKEQGKSGAEALLYYLGIVEHDVNN